MGWLPWCLYCIWTQCALTLWIIYNTVDDNVTIIISCLAFRLGNYTAIPYNKSLDTRRNPCDNHVCVLLGASIHLRCWGRYSEWTNVWRTPRGRKRYGCLPGLRYLLFSTTTVFWRRATMVMELFLAYYIMGFIQQGLTKNSCHHRWLYRRAPLVVVVLCGHVRRWGYPRPPGRVELLGSGHPVCNFPRDKVKFALFQLPTRHKTLSRTEPAGPFLLQYCSLQTLFVVKYA